MSMYYVRMCVCVCGRREGYVRVNGVTSKIARLGLKERSYLRGVRGILNCR